MARTKCTVDAPLLLWHQSISRQSMPTLTAVWQRGRNSFRVVICSKSAFCLAYHSSRASGKRVLNLYTATRRRIDQEDSLRWKSFDKLGDGIWKTAE
jgi:hypothetical protein